MFSTLPLTPQGHLVFSYPLGCPPSYLRLCSHLYPGLIPSFQISSLQDGPHESCSTWGRVSPLSPKCLVYVKTVSQPKPQPSPSPLYLTTHLLCSLPLPCHLTLVTCMPCSSLCTWLGKHSWPFIAFVLFPCLSIMELHPNLTGLHCAVAPPCSVLQRLHFPSLTLSTQLLPKALQSFMSSVSSLPSCFTWNF